ncbi:uncharacterized protein LOC131929664 [Physella acuta]|uniref:uncharacterized protein LOC131929664 n=1 Tax=Physella acuta TaxID=109671 RepID=UPI0027DB582F|nr:uncharacterized protein LOC131929664 [Physella acuta]
MPKRKRRTTPKKKKNEEPQDDVSESDSTDKPSSAKKVAVSSTSQDEAEQISNFASVSLINSSDTSLAHFWCNYCEFSTEVKNELVSHMRQHMVKCSYCAFSSLSRSEVVKHSKVEHDKELDTTTAEVDSSSSGDCEMDKDPCSACVFCDFMTYSTDHLEKHTVTKHPGMLPKSVAKMIKKEVSAQVRKDDALFYLPSESIIERTNTSTDTIVIDPVENKKPKDVKFEVNSAFVDSKAHLLDSLKGKLAEDRIIELLKKSTEKTSDEPLSSSEDKEPRSNWNVKVETMYCLTCPYSNAYVDKLKCHTIVQHPVGAAVGTYNTAGEGDQDLTFFCVREACSYNSNDPCSYQKHLIECCSCQETMSVLEKERLKSTMTYVLDYLKKLSKIAEEGFLDFASQSLGVGVFSQYRKLQITHASQNFLHPRTENSSTSGLQNFYQAPVTGLQNTGSVGNLHRNNDPQGIPQSFNRNMEWKTGHYQGLRGGNALDLNPQISPTVHQTPLQPSFQIPNPTVSSNHSGLVGYSLPRENSGPSFTPADRNQGFVPSNSLPQASNTFHTLSSRSGFNPALINSAEQIGTGLQHSADPELNAQNKQQSVNLISDSISVLLNQRSMQDVSSPTSVISLTEQHMVTTPHAMQQNFGAQRGMGLHNQPVNSNSQDISFPSNTHNGPPQDMPSVPELNVVPEPGSVGNHFQYPIQVNQQPVPNNGSFGALRGALSTSSSSPNSNKQVQNIPNFLVTTSGPTPTAESPQGYVTAPTFLNQRPQTGRATAPQLPNTPPRNANVPANVAGASPLSPSIYLSGQVPRHKRSSWTDADMRPKGAIISTMQNRGAVTLSGNPVQLYQPPQAPQAPQGHNVRQRLFSAGQPRGRGGRGRARMYPQSQRFGLEEDDDVIVTAVVRSAQPEQSYRQPLGRGIRGSGHMPRGRAPNAPRMPVQFPSPNIPAVSPQRKGAALAHPPPPPKQFDISKHFEDLACVVNSNLEEEGRGDDDIQILGMTPGKDKEKSKAVDASMFSFCCVHCGKDQGSKNVMKQHMKTRHNDSLLGAFTNKETGQFLFFCPQLNCEFMTYDEHRLSEHLHKCFNLDSSKPFDILTAVKNLKSMKIRQLDVRTIGRSQDNPIDLDGQGMKDNFSSSLNDAYGDIVVSASGRQIARPQTPPHLQPPPPHPYPPQPRGPIRGPIPPRYQDPSSASQRMRLNNYPQQHGMRPPGYTNRPNYMNIRHPRPTHPEVRPSYRPNVGPHGNPRMMMGGMRGMAPRAPRMIAPPPQLLAPQVPIVTTQRGGEQEPIVIDLDADSPEQSVPVPSPQSFTTLDQPFPPPTESSDHHMSVLDARVPREVTSSSIPTLQTGLDTYQNHPQALDTGTANECWTPSSVSQPNFEPSNGTNSLAAQPSETNCSNSNVQQANSPQPLASYSKNNYSSVLNDDDDFDEEERVNAVVLEKVFAKVPNMPKTLSHRLVSKFKEYANFRGVKITPDSKVIDEFVSKISYKGNSNDNSKESLPKSSNVNPAPPPTNYDGNSTSEARGINDHLNSSSSVDETYSNTHDSVDESCSNSHEDESVASYSQSEDNTDNEPMNLSTTEDLSEVITTHVILPQHTIQFSGRFAHIMQKNSAGESEASVSSGDTQLCGETNIQQANNSLMGTTHSTAGETTQSPANLQSCDIQGNSASPEHFDTQEKTAADPEIENSDMTTEHDMTLLKNDTFKSTLSDLSLPLSNNSHAFKQKQKYSPRRNSINFPRENCIIIKTIRRSGSFPLNLSSSSDNPVSSGKISPTSGDFSVLSRVSALPCNNADSSKNISSSSGKNSPASGNFSTLSCVSPTSGNFSTLSSVSPTSGNFSTLSCVSPTSGNLSTSNGGSASSGNTAVLDCSSAVICNSNTSALDCSQATSFDTLASAGNSSPKDTSNPNLVDDLILEPSELKQTAHLRSFNSACDSEVAVLYPSVESGNEEQDSAHRISLKQDQVTLTATTPTPRTSSVYQIVSGHADLEVDVAEKPDDTNLYYVSKQKPHETSNKLTVTVRKGVKDFQKQQRTLTKIMPKKAIGDGTIKPKRQSKLVDMKTGKLVLKVTKKGRPRKKAEVGVKVQVVAEKKDEEKTADNDSTKAAIEISGSLVDEPTDKEASESLNVEPASELNEELPENTDKIEEMLKTPEKDESVIENTEIFVRRSDRKRKVILSDYRASIDDLSDEDEEFNFDDDDDDDSDSDKKWQSELHSNKKKVKKTKPAPDPTAYNTSTKGKYKCWLCKKIFLKCGCAKVHLLKKHQEGLCSVDVLQTEETGSLHLLLYCPRDCKYATFSLEGFKSHVESCEKPVQKENGDAVLEKNKTFIDCVYPELINTEPKVLLETSKKKPVAKDPSKPRKRKKKPVVDPGQAEVSATFSPDGNTVTSEQRSQLPHPSSVGTHLNNTHQALPEDLSLNRQNLSQQNVPASSQQHPMFSRPMPTPQHRMMQNQHLPSHFPPAARTPNTASRLPVQHREKEMQPGVHPKAPQPYYYQQLKATQSKTFKQPLHNTGSVGQPQHTPGQPQHMSGQHQVHNTGSVGQPQHTSGQPQHMSGQHQVHNTGSVGQPQHTSGQHQVHNLGSVGQPQHTSGQHQVHNTGSVGQPQHTLGQYQVHNSGSVGQPQHTSGQPQHTSGQHQVHNTGSVGQPQHTLGQHQVHNSGQLRYGSEQHQMSGPAGVLHRPATFQRTVNPSRDTVSPSQNLKYTPHTYRHIHESHSSPPHQNQSFSNIQEDYTVEDNGTICLE